MKKVLIYIPIIFLFSCSKSYLDRNNPTSTTDDKWWTTQSNLDAALSDIYSSVPSGQYAYNANARMIFSALTDNAFWNGNFYGEINTLVTGGGSSSMGWPAGNLDASDPGIWGVDYTKIRRACRFIDNAGKAYMDPALKARYIYEARAMRAWYTLELWLYFKNIPIVKDPVTPTEAPDMTNSSQADIISFLTTELDTCAANLPTSYTTNEVYRMTKGACLSMKAICYLNAGMYQKAADAAKVVMNLTDSTGAKVYSLYPSYSGLFSYSGQINKEGIITNPNGLKEVWFRNAPYGISPGPQQAALNPTASLVNAYETRQGKTLAEMSSDSAKIYQIHPNYNNNRDPRFAASILYGGQTFAGDLLQPFSASSPDRIGSPTGSQTGFWCAKYLDLQDRGHTYSGTNHFMILRYAQILLIRVEALVESGNWQDPDVLFCLNKIRNRAGMPDVDVTVYNSQAKMRELYRRERRVELAFEGWRWFDIRRWNIGSQAMNGPVYGAINPATGSPVLVQTRHFASRDKLWPIPLNEINTSKIVQNPGW